MRGAEIAIEELNEAGGICGGRPIKYVKADTAQDVTEGIKAFEYLCEVEHVDAIISGSVDDVSLGWLPRLAEYQMPTVDTWTSAVSAIEMVREDYDSYKPYFLNFPCDYLLGAAYLDFGKNVLHDELGWETAVVFNEDTAYGVGTAEWLLAEAKLFADIEVIGNVVYDPNTVDYAPFYAEMVAMDPDFIWHIASINCIPVSAQYVEGQVPLPIIGINVAAFGQEFWSDTGELAAGFSVLMPGMNLGMDHDPRTQAFVDKYQETYKSRPVYPHYNGMCGYYGIYEMANAANAVYEAGGEGFDPLDDWVKAMEQGEIVLKKDGKTWWVWSFYEPGEVEEITGLTFPHDGKFDMTGENGMPSCLVVNWYQDGTAKCVYPEKYAIGEFELPWWIEE